MTQAVSEFASIGCAVEVPFLPYILNPLSVAINKSGKKRLILDLSILNLSAKKEKIKFEDWKVAVQYFEKDCYMYKLAREILLLYSLSVGYFGRPIHFHQMFKTAGQILERKFCQYCFVFRRRIWYEFKCTKMYRRCPIR